MPRWTTLVLGGLAVSLVGCAEPFEETRQDLVAFRIAAVGVHEGTAVAALWSGEGLYHHSAPGLAWTLNDQGIGEGWDVPVPGHGTLGLTATGPEGTVRQAEVSVREGPAESLTVLREAVELGEDLDLASREGVEGSAVDTRVESGQGVRLILPDLEEAESLRWMLGGGVGTLLELAEDRADLLRAEVLFEEDEVLELEDLGDGPLHSLVLAIDGGGGNRWLWADAAVGGVDSLARHEGRLVPFDGAASPGWLAVTLVSDEGLGGLAFEDAVPVMDLAEQESMDCALSELPFRLAWVAEGRCLLPDVLGARVVVEVW